MLTVSSYGVSGVPGHSRSQDTANVRAQLALSPGSLLNKRACPQPAAFFSRRTRITPSTYVYTSFVSDLVLAKSVAVGKMPRQTLLFDRLLYWPHIAWARCHHYEIESTISGP